MDFTARLVRGETITSVVSVTITPVTTPPMAAGSPIFTSTKVQIPMSGGLANTRYTVIVLVQTTVGIRKGVGYIQFSEDGE
jgi:hypothetical protein